jgi:hypothetical protein
LIFVAFLPACLGQPAVGAPAPGGGQAALQATFSSIETLVFSPRCSAAACHGQGGTPPRLDAEGAWFRLVDAPSEQAPGLPLVSPSDPSRSYLLHKLVGEQAAVGGWGTPMPPDGAALSADEIDTIRAWIAGGAPND